MEYLPVFLQLAGAPCLVVGGGEVAARKLALLRKAGADVTVVAPRVCDEVAALAREGKLRLEQRAFEPADMAGRRAVIAATDNHELNARVSALASLRGVPVNVVDTPALCSFIVPSIVDRSPVVIAISTAGAAPVLARILRTRLEALMPPRLGALAALCREYRDRVKQRLGTVAKRRRFWESLLEGPLAGHVYAGRQASARSLLESALKDGTPPGAAGEVYLVGSGPGDPDLLSFRALRLMQQADVVVHDRLVTAEILDLVRRDATRIYAGKERGNHAIPQGGINRLLIDLARKGQRVLRLKGGDPFVFGRGGEEIETLAQSGIPFQVVPGITAASGCAAYAGIPLTHRDYSQACVLVTGHLHDGRVNLAWEALVRPKQTLVIYMGLVGLPLICRELIRHGMPAHTPAALVQQGSTRHQRVFTGTVQTLPDIVTAGGARAPTLIIIGEVVRLRDKLNWFDP